jgi:hypothetical protein
MTSKVKVIKLKFLKLVPRTKRYLYIFVLGRTEIRVPGFKNLIDLFDLPNDLRAQSC